MISSGSGPIRRWSTGEVHTTARVTPTMSERSVVTVVPSWHHRGLPPGRRPIWWVWDLWPTSAVRLVFDPSEGSVIGAARLVVPAPTPERPSLRRYYVRWRRIGRTV